MELSKELLEQLGLTKTEAIVFSELIYLGKAQIGEIIKKTSLHRGTVYNTIQRLIEKGAVAVATESNQMIYSPSPFAFMGTIEEEKKQLEQKEQTIQQILKQAKLSKQIDNTQTTEVKVLYGAQAFKNFFRQLLAESKEESYKYIGDGGDMRDVMGGEYYKYSQELKQKMKVPCKVILNQDRKKHVFAKEVKGNIRWLPIEQEFNTDTWIFKDNVVIVDWFKKPINIVTIQNNNISNTYNEIFKQLWRGKALKQKELSK